MTMAVLAFLGAVLVACSPPDAGPSVMEPDPSASTITASHDAAPLGEPFEVTVQLRDADGGPLPRAGQMVTFVATSGDLAPATLDGGFVSTETVNTDAEGRASVTLTPTGPGTITVRAHMGEGTSGASLGSVSVTVSQTAVEVDALTVTYDGAPKGVAPRFYPPDAIDGATIVYFLDGVELDGPPSDAGEYTVTVTAGTGYDESATATVTIEPRALAVTDVVWTAKPYDGTTVATAAAATLDTSNVVADDDVVLATRRLGAFAASAIGVQPVTGAFTLAGADAANYVVDPQPTGQAAIAAAEVTLEDAAVQAKTYDGTAAATVTGTLAGVADGDDVAYAASFAAADAGADVAVTVELSGADAANYQLAPLELAGTITPAPLTIAPGDGQGKQVGEPDPILTFDVTGFAAGDDASLLSGSLTRAEGESIGSYPFEIGSLDAGPNYSLALSADAPDFDIVQTTLTITPDVGQTKVYGAVDPAFTYTVEGGVAVTGTLDRVEGEAVGTYAFALGTLDAGPDYALTLGEDAPTFAVTPATMAIVADAAPSKTYGQDDPTFTYTATGFAPGEDASVLSGALGRESGHDVGTYGVTRGSLDAGPNYAIDFTGATFSITPALLTITPDTGQTKLIGDADPVFTFSAAGLVAGETTAVLTGALGREPGEVAGTYAFTLGDLAAENYELGLGGNATFAIGSVSLEGATVTYDGASHELVAAFAPDEAADGATVTYVDEEGATLPGAPTAVGTYTVTATAGTGYSGSATASLVIEPRPLAVTNVEFADKVYDAGTGATLGATLVTTNIVAGDDVRLVDRLVGTFASSTVGTHHVVGTIELTGADASNYAIDPQPVGTAAITLRDVTLVGGVAADKAYDGTATAVVSGELAGVRPADLGDIGYEARFSQADAGTDLPVTVTLTGEAAANYRLVDPALSASITPRSVTVTVSDLVVKPYGEALELGSTSSFVAENVAPGESIDTIVISSDGATAEAPSGTYAVNGADPTGTGFVPGNHDVTFVPGELVVTQRSVTITAATTVWTYGDDPAEGDMAPRVMGDAPLPSFASLAGDLARTALNVGDGIPFTNGTLDIVDGGGASIAANFDVTLGTYAIAPRPATVTSTYAETKTYGDTIDPTTLGSEFFTTDGLAAGESIDAVTFASAGFVADAAVSVTPYPVTLSDPTGTSFDPANYDLTFVPGSLTVQPRTLTVSGSFTVAERAYDGTTAAPVADATALALENAIGGDDVALSPIASYADALVGEGKTATLTAASTLTGDAAPNYALSLDGAPTSTGTIVKADIAFDVTIAGTGGAKTVVYDGGTTFQPNVTTSLAPIPDDQPVAFIVDIRYLETGESRGSFRDVGQYEVTVTADDPRYQGQSVVNDLYVLAREIVIAASATGKTYGDPNPELLPAMDAGSPYGLGAGDAFAGGELAYAGSTETNLAVGAYPFDLGAATIERGGVDVTANYDVTFATDFTIDARTLTVAPDEGQAKTYGDADPTFTFVATGFATGDDATLLSGALARGEGEDVGTYPFALGTLDAGANYALALPAEPATFEVTARPVVLTAATTDVVYGDTGHDLTALLAGGSTLREGDVLAGALAMGTTDAGTWTFGLGDATFTRDDGDVSGNYAVTFGEYTVQARAAVIVPDANQAKTYGDPDPTSTYTVQNLVDGDAFTGALGRSSGEDVGTYAFTLGDLANANYVIALAEEAATFEVTPRAITLGATVASKEYSDDDPDLTPVLLDDTTLRADDVLTGALAHGGVDVGTYDFGQGTVQVMRDDVTVTGNYVLSFGTFTIEPKPVSFDIVNADATIMDGDASAKVFLSDGTSAIRGLEVASTPAGMTSFRFSYRRTHDENHTPVPSGQQSVQNINLLGSYVVTVTASDPNYVGATPIDVWVTDVSEVAYTDESVDSAVLGSDALVTVELRNGDGVARAAGSAGLPLDLAVRDGATATLSFRNADDTEAVTHLSIPAGASQVSYRVVPEAEGAANLTATTVTNPEGTLGEASLGFDAIRPNLTAVDDGPYDVVAGGTREILIADLLANDTWDGVDGFEFTGVTAEAGVTATVSGDRIVVAADPDAGNTTGTFDYRIATTGTYATSAIGTVSIDVTLAPIDAILFDARAEFDDFTSSSYTPPTFADVLAEWPVFEGATVYDNVASATGSSFAYQWAYDAASESVVQPGNASPPTGFISTEALEYYSFEATLASSNGDNDAMGLVIAYDTGTNSYLVAVRGQNGGPSLAPAAGWGLWYYQNGARTQIVNDVSVGATYSGWTGYESRVSVERTGDVVRLKTTPFAAAGTTFTATDYLASSTITVDLASGQVQRADGGATVTYASQLQRFRGAKPYGYWTYSQPDSKYLDVVFEGGTALDTAILLTGFDAGANAYAGSEVWTYDAASSAWVEQVGQTIQTLLGYPRTVTSVAEPIAGSAYPSYAVNGTSFRIEAARTVALD